VNSPDASQKVGTKVATANSSEPSAFLLTERDHVTAQLLELGKHIAWDGGYDLRGLTITQTDDGWLVVVKAVRRGRPYAAYLVGQSFQDALFLAGEWAYEARYVWKHDKWPSKHTKKELGIS
jgi:hypothetical protein